MFIVFGLYCPTIRPHFQRGCGVPKVHYTVAYSHISVVFCACFGFLFALFGVRVWAADLARLCNVSERGIYRYLGTLSRADISIRFRGGGHAVPKRMSEVAHEIMREIDREEHLQTIGTLLSIGLANSDDDELIQYGKESMKLLDENGDFCINP
jgi:hypothetical protein